MNYQPQAIHYDCDSEINTEFENPAYTFMQYTGLKDKDGVEIYEGDILKWRKPMAEVVSKEEKGKSSTAGCVERVYQVIWDNGWYQKGEMSNALEWGNPEVSEVMGNIYENPELLQE
ncbi:YopX family protein [Roseobacter sp.]|uniref:YopX family protein n=1 Tax=Roseobacter sp. TaxID=1907202 RepID=UPI00385CD708